VCARAQNGFDLAQAIHAQGAAGGGEIHDYIGDAQVRRDFGSSRHRDHIYRPAGLLEEAAGDVGKDGGHAHALPILSDIGHRANTRVLPRGHHEAAPAEAEVEVGGEGASRFVHQVPAGHAHVGGAVGHELGDVLSAHEDGLELPAEGSGEGALAGRADFESGVVEEFAGVFGEAPLVGEGDTEHRVF